MSSPEYKIGSGYDIHRLVKGRPLILGGVEIDFDRGLEGHSDADVLVHAVCDAVLGAAGKGDIGEHFPDTDDQYKGISSMILLEKCCRVLESEGYGILNMDCTIFAQVPKLSPYKRLMEENLAKCMKLDVSRVNVKATTTEKLGFVGREEGICAHCTLMAGAR